MTIDDLALMIQRQFSATEERFVSIDQRFEQIDQRFEQVNNRMETGFANLEAKLDYKFHLLQGEIEDIKERLDRIEKRTLEDDNVLSTEIVDIKKRVNLIEKKLAQMR